MRYGGAENRSARRKFATMSGGAPAQPSVTNPIEAMGDFAPPMAETAPYHTTSPWA
jgi:hypothetical protein